MSYRIWFNKPAGEWEEGFPIGNGRLGAMVLGSVEEEVIYLNEESIWYGGSKDRHNPDALVHLQSIRALLFEGRIEEAQRLCKISLGSTPQYINPYLPGGYIAMFFSKEHDNYTHYERSLDLKEALVKVAYQIKDITYTREILSSFKDQVIVLHLTGSKTKRLSFTMNINRRPYDGETKAIDSKTLLMTCEAGKEGVAFATVVNAQSVDGRISTCGNYLVIEEATAVTLYIATQTTYHTKNYIREALDQVNKARDKGYEKIKQEHIQDYKELFDRSSIALIDSTEKKGIHPTNELINRCRAGKEDKELVELIYNFGKYLLIASSRVGGLPSNLQGIWNMSYTPAWESNYTININTQMNYWLAEVNNLGVCHEPLFDFIERLCENGKYTAQTLYGCKGSVAHHVSNIWADSAPGGIYEASPYWPMGLAWLSLHMYEHYLYTGDNVFLKERCYPVLKEVATFYIDYLVESPDGYLVTGPSVSPENSYISEYGKIGALCMGPTMDIEIIREVFKAFKGCYQEINDQGNLLEQIERVEKKLPPIQIGKHGQIMEWYKELEEVEPGHRHISPLFALHPGSQITQATLNLFKGAEVTLERRLAEGGGHTGWSRAWIINFYARLLNGEKAYLNVLELLKKSVRISLLDIHPPFQIDGNFGSCAGITEMLMQSHEGFIRILPACPKVWDKGEVRGLCARGGFVIDFKWGEGQIRDISIQSCAGNLIRLKLDNELSKINDNQGNLVKYHFKENLLVFSTEIGMVYELTFIK